MSTYPNYPDKPLLASQGGITYNHDHIEYWIQRAEQAERALRPFAEAFRKYDDPGVSDLDNEQPVSLHVLLGAWRKASSVLRAAQAMKL